MSPTPGNLTATIRDPSWLHVTPVQMLQTEELSFQLSERVGRIMVKNSSNARLSCAGSAFPPLRIKLRERIHRVILQASIVDFSKTSYFFI